jgi:2-keto-4-pentenoate hydratase/2-oxohepta-3-ene-1,7-dioic acid hydratase in catechol pathway
MKDVKLHAPIPRPAKNVFCVGWNYLEHFEEGAKKLQDNRELPQWPVFFSKAPTAVNGPCDPIPFDASISTSLDWEVELGVVIGPGGKDIKAEDAMGHVWGYTVINDVSWRDLQRRHGQWFKGKSLDRSCPLGPVIVPAADLDAADLAIGLKINGQQRQASRTSKMIFDVKEIIHQLSAGFTLLPGDVIMTGTPEGVAAVVKGDVLEGFVEGVGEVRTKIV